MTELGELVAYAVEELGLGLEDAAAWADEELARRRLTQNDPRDMWGASDGCDRPGRERPPLRRARAPRSAGRMTDADDAVVEDDVRLLDVETWVTPRQTDLGNAE